MTESTVREQRVAAGITQAELARRLGISQPAVAALERVSRQPNDSTVQRVRRALADRPSDVLARHVPAVLRLIDQHHGRRAYVFGSVSRAEDTLLSDIDLLVEFEEGTSLLDHAALYLELTDLLAPYAVDLVSKRALTAKHSAIMSDMRELL